MRDPQDEDSIAFQSSSRCQTAHLVPAARFPRPGFCILASLTPNEGWAVRRDVVEMQLTLAGPYPNVGEPQSMRPAAGFLDSDTPLESVRRRRFNPPTARARGQAQHRRNAMAKGQMRSNKEKKKPKAEWNKKKKGGPALSPFALAREQPQPGQNPFAKKS